MATFTPGRANTGLAVLTADTDITPGAHAGAGFTIMFLETGANAMITATLPAATGTGNTYKFVCGNVNNFGYKIQVASADDTIVGQVVMLDLDGSALTSFQAGGTDDTFLFDANSTSGGRIGDWVELTDILSGKWQIRGHMAVVAGQNPADPFTTAVS